MAYERDFLFKRYGVEVPVKGLGVVYPESKVDPTYYRPNSELISEFIRAGEGIRALQHKQYYDFPDGKDDGSDVPLRGNYEPAEISTMANLHAAEMNVLEKDAIDKKKRKEDSLKELKELLHPEADKASGVSGEQGNAPQSTNT